MGEKNSAPQAPDLSPLYSAAQNASNEAAQHGNEQYQWAQNQFANTSAANNNITAGMAQDASNLNNVGQSSQNLSQNALDQQQNSQALQNNAIGLQTAATGQAAQNQANANTYNSEYQNTTVPEIQQYQNEANQYSNPAFADQQAAAAGATVGEQYDAARNNSIQNLESYGVNPASTRFGALDIGTRTQQAAATAGAENQSRLNTQNTGLQLQQNAVNMGQQLASTGQGYAGLANSSTGNAISAANTANSAGGQAISANQAAVGANNSASGAYTGAASVGSSAGNLNNATFSTGASAMGNPTSYYGLQGSDLTGAANIENSQYQDQLSQFNANQNASSGLGSLLGTAAGIGMKAFGFAEGGAVPAVNATGGGAIPMNASPSRGAITDDIPARLNAGEFVIPRDVASHLGTKQLNALVQKSRTEMQGGARRPAVGGPQQPRPQQGAIPMRAAA